MKTSESVPVRSARDYAAELVWPAVFFLLGFLAGQVFRFPAFGPAPLDPVAYILLCGPIAVWSSLFVSLTLWRTSRRLLLLGQDLRTIAKRSDTKSGVSG